MCGNAFHSETRPNSKAEPRDNTRADEDYHERFIIREVGEDVEAKGVRAKQQDEPLACLKKVLTSQLTTLTVVNRCLPRRQFVMSHEQDRVAKRARESRVILCA